MGRNLPTCPYLEVADLGDAMALVDSLNEYHPKFQATARTAHLLNTTCSRVGRRATRRTEASSSPSAARALHRQHRDRHPASRHEELSVKVCRMHMRTPALYGELVWGRTVGTPSCTRGQTT